MSEPRKSRREAKPTQRLKEFLGEETAKSTPKASKVPTKTAPAPKASAKNEKLAATKSTPEKASPAKKGAAKLATVSKVPNAKASTPAVKAATPASKAATPAVKASTPAVKASTPAVKASTPAVKASTPAVKASTPAVKASTPAVKASTPAVKASTLAAKAARNTLPREDYKPSPAPSRSNVTQSVKNTSIKEAKKATPLKGLVEKEPEILRTKRVSKPSAKVAEAMEAEAEVEQVIKKPVLTPASKAAKPAPVKIAPQIAGRGGRGRGVSGLKDRGRGRGRGRGRPLTHTRLADEEEDDEFDVPEMKDLDDEDDDIEDAEDELMDVDEADEEAMEEDEEEEEDDEDEDEPPATVANKLKKGPVKQDVVVKKSVFVAERNSSNEPANKGSNDAPVPAVVKASLTGAILNPIVKKVVTSVGSPVKVTPQVLRKDNNLGSPAKGNTVKQVSKSGGGVKRFLTTASPPASPLAKKLKLSSDEPPSTGGTVAGALSPSKPVSVKTQAVSIVTSSASVAAANGVRQKVATVKTVAKTIYTSAKVQPKTGLSKMESSMVNDAAENRRSRRQPKPTERMKEFLHKSSEEEEEGDMDDPSAFLGGEMDSEEDEEEEEEEEEEEDDEDMDEEDDEESGRRFMEFMSKAAGGQKNKKPDSAKGSKAGAARPTPQKFIKTQLVRKGSQSGPIGRGASTVVAMQNKVDNAVVGGAMKTPKVVQVQTSKFTPGSKVMVQAPSSVNGDMRKGTVSGLLSGGSIRTVAPGASRKTEPRVPSEPPVIIKIRTRKPEEDEILRKKREEEDKQAGTRKIIKIYTRVDDGRKGTNKGGGSKSSIDPESDSMESDDESEHDDSDSKISKPLSGKNGKLIRLCEEAVESLKQNLKSHKKEQNQNINSKTIEKFIRLSSEIADTVKATINELGDKISNSDNFEEYCQDVLDSIAIKPNGDDISHEEADSLLSWLREQEKESLRSGDARVSDRSSQLVLYSQMLEFLTAAAIGSNLDDEEEMDDEDEEMSDMDMDDEATYDKEYFGDGGEDGDDLDEDEAQEEEEEEEDDYLGEDEEIEEEEEEEEAADDPPPVTSKSAGRR